MTSQGPTQTIGRGAGWISSISSLAGVARGIPGPDFVLLLGVAALVVPTLYSLAIGYWSTSSGAHGPILLVSALWLLARERHTIRLRPNSVSAAWLAVLLPPLLILYAFARTFGILTLEAAALYATLVLLAFYYWGPATVQRLWFAIAYLGFLMRPPAGIVAELTQPLKIWISNSAVSLLHALDYPVASAGVRIQIGQYELLVQQACAGLGSIFSLFAICLLYVHLVRRADAARSMLLLLAVIPVAVGANYLRVLILILLTYHAGNNVAQGFAHDAAGILTFVLSLLGMAAVDKVLMMVPLGRKSNV